MLASTHEDGKSMHPEREDCGVQGFCEYGFPIDMASGVVCSKYKFMDNRFNI